MNAEDYIKKAYELMEKNEYDNAIENLELAEKLEPNNPHVHLVFILAYQFRGLAKKHFQTFSQLDPETAELMIESYPELREDLPTGETLIVDKLVSTQKKCPYCGQVLAENDISLLQSSLVIDAQMQCPSCRRIIRKKDIM